MEAVSYHFVVMVVTSPTNPVQDRPFLITDSEAARAGLTKNHSRRNTKYGGGYPVFFEGLHHLHCLDLVRQSLYYNYDHYLERGAGPFSDPPEVLHWHVCMSQQPLSLFQGISLT